MGSRDLTAGLTLALGLAGGLVAKTLHLPLPMLLGALLAVAIAAVAGWRPIGHSVWSPPVLRLVFVPVIGVSIGAAFTSDMIAAVPGWWPSILALVVFIPVVHWISFAIARALGLRDRAAAFFGTAPGGFIEAIEMGQAAGADVRMLTTLQFLRLVLTILTVPVIFAAITGHAVGSGAGVVLGDRAPLDGLDIAWLIAAGVIGGWLGLRSRLPAGLVLGPVLASGAVHLAGLSDGAPPGWLIATTQVVIGVNLGVRFAGLRGRMLAQAAAISTLSVAMMLALAGGVAVALSRVMDQSSAAIFLAFAPGGLAEMSLIALSLHVSVIYVTAHHLLRIFLAVLAARLLRGRGLGRG
ncbi:AbrB family transcriptional regulator [Paracoccus sp. p3-h83]|uniref:AbrB family transcriptional regulator n=1 Tax=Paracoccus sp. p3-h83 TaxID=3342805 RepID=UPI0035BAE4FA